MTKLNWDGLDKIFEVGVDRGVLYSIDNIGVSWIGLVAVTESPSGGDPESFYIDGQKYLNYGSFEEFEGTIEAYTYPDEFAKHEGTVSIDGLYIHQQRSIPFGLSYRTLIGNETQGSEYAYKIHLVYNAVTLPSDADYITQGEDTETLTFSWEFTTTPANVVESLGNKPLSHISIRSDKTLTSLLNVLTKIMYGTDSSTPRLPELEEIKDLFDQYGFTGYGKGDYGHIPYGGNTHLGEGPEPIPINQQLLIEELKSKLRT